MNWDRFIAIIGRITQRPEVWDQSVPRIGAEGCGCVAAHAIVDWHSAGNNDPKLECYGALMGYIGFDMKQSLYLFSPKRTLAELQQLAITQRFPWEQQP